MAKQPISPETTQEALSIAKATQKPGQTKEQTKLIAKGIEKGIAEYKKRQKDKSRALDKARKKVQQKEKQIQEIETHEANTPTHQLQVNRLLLVTLIISLSVNLAQAFIR